MTLIFSHVNPNTGLFALSDILASRPSHTDPAPISIPFRQEPLTHANAGYSPAGTIQKSVIFGRTLVLFAGTVVIARAIIEQIRSSSRKQIPTTAIFFPSMTVCSGHLPRHAGQPLCTMAWTVSMLPNCRHLEHCSSCRSGQMF
jgi:hypothetical protein